MFETGAPARMITVERGVLSNGLNRLSLLYNTVTGDPGDPLYFPMNAVRWRTPPRDLAALVTDSTRRGFAARLYHFGSGERTLGAEWFLLEPGSYTVSVTASGTGRVFSQEKFRFGEGRREISLQLPAQVELTVSIEAGEGAK